jgi:hypothetical protein
MRVLLPLNFITIAFRIEASRHPVEVQEVFFTLAANVNSDGERSPQARWSGNLKNSGERADRPRFMEKSPRRFIGIEKRSPSTLETSRNQLRALSEALTSSGAGANGSFPAKPGGHAPHRRHRHGPAMPGHHTAEDRPRRRSDGRDARPSGRCRPATSAADSDARQFISGPARFSCSKSKRFRRAQSRRRQSQVGHPSLRTEAGAAAEVAVKVGGPRSTPRSPASARPASARFSA